METPESGTGPNLESESGPRNSWNDHVRWLKYVPWRSGGTADVFWSFQLGCLTREALVVDGTYGFNTTKHWICSVIHWFHWKKNGALEAELSPKSFPGIEPWNTRTYLDSLSLLKAVRFHGDHQTELPASEEPHMHFPKSTYPPVVWNGHGTSTKLPGRQSRNLALFYSYIYVVGQSTTWAQGPTKIRYPHERVQWIYSAFPKNPTECNDSYIPC